MNKQYIRFIVNTAGHPAGEKIKVLNTITKVFDDDGNFIETKKPHIRASDNQIEVDVEGREYKKYLPLRHFKHKDGKIIKKTKAAIDKLEQARSEDKQVKQVAQQQKDVLIDNAKNIIDNSTATDSEKLRALLTLYKEKQL